MFINVMWQRLARRLTTPTAARPDVVRPSFSPEMSRHMLPFRLSLHSSRARRAIGGRLRGRINGSRVGRGTAGQTLGRGRENLAYSNNHANF
jgi:hypothetical protein